MFHAMASPCEVLLDCLNKNIAEELATAISNEAWRIEDKYSRYLPTSVCSAINQSNGKAITVDEETIRLLEFAQQSFLLSDGLFDITSGVLRNAWNFDGSDNVPEQEQIDAVLPFVGWDKVKLTKSTITLEPNMQIDLGGLGKEYAVDTCLIIAKSITDFPVLINFGGDIAATSPQQNSTPWQVGIEHPGVAPSDPLYKQPLVVKISQGAIATSGDARRYLLKNNKRYSHVLNPKTGWSMTNSPKSITVVAPNCIQAGFLATLALLQGEQAEQFLIEQDIGSWCIW
ncbi:FAD:protein FMN transferase [Thalassomonas sp. M1454]|nr:FAD:protein FMN transferase [Thalassomonas sp. M1454]